MSANPDSLYSTQRYIIDYTPRHLVHAAARVAGWKTWADSPASKYVDPLSFARVKICDTLPEALAFAQELCERGADYFDAVSVQKEIREQHDWRAVRVWTVTKIGPDDPHGREIKSQ